MNIASGKFLQEHITLIIEHKLILYCTNFKEIIKECVALSFEN